MFYIQNDNGQYLAYVENDDSGYFWSDIGDCFNAEDVDFIISIYGGIAIAA